MRVNADDKQKVEQTGTRSTNRNASRTHRQRNCSNMSPSKKEKCCLYFAYFNMLISIDFLEVFIARRYASAVYAVAVGLSVCTSKVVILYTNLIVTKSSISIHSLFCTGFRQIRIKYFEIYCQQLDILTFNWTQFSPKT